MSFEVVHASGRFDRPPDELGERLDELAAAGAAEIIGLTEQGNLSPARRRALRVKGWSWFHDDSRGADDVAALWDASRWALDGWARTVPITSMVWKRVAEYGGKTTPPVHAAVVPLRSLHGEGRVVAVVVHMPTRSTLLRRRAWASCIAGLVKLFREIRKADPGARIVLMWDVNADWHNAADRKLLEKTARRLNVTVCWAKHPTSEGSHGRRLIDGVWTDLEILDADVLAVSRASDHKPVSAECTRRRP